MCVAASSRGRCSEAGDGSPRATPIHAARGYFWQGHLQRPPGSPPLSMLSGCCLAAVAPLTRCPLAAGWLAAAPPGEAVRKQKAGPDREVDQVKARESKRAMTEG